MNDDIREAVVSLKRERIMAAAVDLFYQNGFGPACGTARVGGWRRRTSPTGWQA